MRTLRQGGRPGALRAARGWARGLDARTVALLVLVLTNCLWAGTYTAGKIALGALSPVELNALRFSMATLLLAPALARGWRQIPRDRRSLLTLALLTLLGFVLNKALEYAGLALTTASDVALLIATESIFTAALSWALLGERVTRVGVAALVVGLAGAYLVVARGLAPQVSGGGGAQRIIGDLVVVLSLLVESGYTVVGKRNIRRLPPLLLTSATLAGSLVVWVPAGVVAVARGGWPHMTWTIWLAVAYMAVLATVVGYWLWFRALMALDASAAAPTLFLQPLLGALIAIWLLHERIIWATLAGGAMIGVSLALVTWGARRPRGAAEGASVVRSDEPFPALNEPIP